MKKIITLLLVASLLVIPVTTALAEDYTVNGGDVTWNGSDIQDNIKNVNDQISAMQPGDTLTYTVEVKNSASADVDFWMSNKILASFEDNTEATGGAYTYKLEYSGKDGSEVFFNSAAVGGDAEKGLYGVEDSIDKNAYFFLGTVAANGGNGTVTLYVKLDGETQGNTYQDKVGALELVFGVEEPTQTTKTENKTVNQTVNKTTDVKTGDTNMMPFSIVVIIAGAALLVLAATRRKKTVRG